MHSEEGGTTDCMPSTFSPLGDKDAIFQKLQEVAAELESDMVHNGWTGKTVTLKYKLDTYQGWVLGCALS